jgi:hypothetical protein
LHAGEARLLEAAIPGWRFDRLAIAAGAGVSLLVLAFMLLWLVSR